MRRRRGGAVEGGGVVSSLISGRTRNIRRVNEHAWRQQPQRGTEIAAPPILAIRRGAGLAFVLRIGSADRDISRKIAREIIKYLVVARRDANDRSFTATPLCARPSESPADRIARRT